MMKVKLKGEIVSINVGVITKVRIVIPSLNMVEGVELLHFKDISFLMAFRAKVDEEIIKLSIKNAIFKNINFDDFGESKFDFIIEALNTDLNTLCKLKGITADIVVVDKI